MELQVSGKLKAATTEQPSSQETGLRSFRIEALFGRKFVSAPRPGSTSGPIAAEVTGMDDVTAKPLKQGVESTSGRIAASEGPIPVRVAALVALTVVSLPTVAQDDLAQCLQLFGSGIIPGGGAISIRNICDECVKFDPRVEHSSGQTSYVSTGAVLGQPIWSIELNAKAQQRISYGRDFGDGSYTVRLNNPRSCE